MRSVAYVGWSPSGGVYWLIRDGVRGDGVWDFEAFSVEFEGEKTLTVFTDEGRAEMFAWLVVMEGSPRAIRHGSGGHFRARDLQPKSCGGGELVSLLAGGGSRGGPCAGVERVALDPPPEILFAGELDGLDVHISCVSRDAFTEELIVRGGVRFDAERSTKQGTERDAELEKG